MKIKEFFQSTKRFTVALALSCSLLVGVAGVQIASNHSQEAPAYTEPADDNGTIVLEYQFYNDGNFWAG